MKYIKPAYTKNEPEEDVLIRRKDDVENEMRQKGIVNWRRAAQDRAGWTATREVLVLGQ
jgi:hypothetical protein